jgi:hypothetical protein
MPNASIQLNVILKCDVELSIQGVSKMRVLILTCSRAC